MRAFTLLELMVAVAMIATLTALGLAGLSETIALARYRADRAKLFLAFTEARDVARDRRQPVRVHLTTGQAVVEVFTLPGCFGAATTVATVDIPSIAVPFVQDKCIAPQPGMGTAPVTFSPVGGPFDTINNTNDGRFSDSWGEFGIEGAAQANLCDIEDSPTCGR